MTGMTDLLWKLFVNRSDRYLIQSDVWNWSDSRLTKKIVGQHLEGNIRIGIAELDRESLTKFVLLDIDKHTSEAAERFDAVVDRLRKTVDSHRGTSFKNAIRFIHTGSGIHLIMFFNQKAPAKILKESFLFPLLEECGFRVEDSKWFDGDVQMGEIFPRQDIITTDGYAVRLPLGRHKNGEWSKVMFGQDLRSVITIRLGKKLLDTFKSDSKTREKKKYDPLPDWSTPKNKVALPGCIITLMDRRSVHDGTHQNNLDLGQALVVSGYSVNDIHTIFFGMKGYRFSVTQYQIQDTIKRIRKGILLPKTYRCETYTNATHGLTCDAIRCPRESHSIGVPPTMIYDDIEDPMSENITVGGTPVERVRKVYKKWFFLVPLDIEVIDVGLVCILDRDLPGDPLWMFLVAPSGGMKTEIIRSISKYHRAFTLDKLTPQTFISGKIVTVPGSKTDDNPEGDKRPAGILQYLNGKVLVIKDFTVILGMRKENRYEIFAQLRSIYDGYLEMAFGSMHFPVRVKADIGFVAGVTPAIDDHIKVTTTLGERFLKIRQHPDSMATTTRSQQNLGYEVEMRHEISGAVKSFLMNLEFDRLAKFTTQQIHELILLANYVAKMRVWVRVETWQGKVININPVEPEVPTRVVKQLKKLGIGLALVRGHSKIMDEDMDTLRRVVRDTCIPIRQKIAEQFIDSPHDELTYTDLRNETGHHFTSVRIECTKMVQIGILNHREEEIKDKQGSVIRTVNYLSLTDEFKPLLATTRYTKERPMQEIREFDISGDKEEGETDPPDPDIPKKKTLPREVKKFEKWLSPLPNAGQRGFKESDAKKAHGEGHLEQFSKYVKEGWIEQRKDSKTWWISDTGKAALRGDA